MYYYLNYFHIKYVDYFIIVESSFTHRGDKRNLKFDHKKFEKFKDKIIYLKIEEEPKDLIYNVKNGKKIEEGTNIRLNAIKRIAHQRNFLNEGIIGASKDDLIFYSDNDEIPNLEFFDTHKVKNEIKKTKLFNNFLEKNKLKNSVLISDKDSKNKIIKSARNIPNLKIIDELGTNAYDLLKYKNVIFTITSIKSFQNRVTKWKNSIT